jgi:nucleoid-associated protein YgaU
MTSDAKVGLLLGLIFIFVIAFIINGWPGSKQTDDSNHLTQQMVGTQYTQNALGAAERRAQRTIYDSRPLVVRTQPEMPEQIEESAPRFVMTLPGNPEHTVTQQAPPAPVVLIPQQEAIQPTTRITPRRPGPRTYTVQDGDNLSKIALKVYGPEEGNRLVNIDRIYKANALTLNSPDEVRVGDRLVIPPLPEQTTTTPAPTTTIGDVLPADQFERVEAVGRPQPVQSRLNPRVCVVKEGDSLWRIASKHLGDGKRYTEIAKLNADLLDNENNLREGMRLRLPPN